MNQFLNLLLLKHKFLILQISWEHSWSEIKLKIRKVLVTHSPYDRLTITINIINCFQYNRIVILTHPVFCCLDTSSMYSSTSRILVYFLRLAFRFLLYFFLFCVAAMIPSVRVYTSLEYTLVNAQHICNSARNYGNILNHVNTILEWEWWVTTR